MAPDPDAFFTAGGPLAQALPGYEPRPQQAEMARRVAEALAGPYPLLCEAPTGTGKTLAYLAPAVLSGLRVVVSTGTRHLQEQILHKDLPLLERALGRPISAVLLKGIANYLCLRRLTALEERAGALLPHEADALSLVRDWRGRTGTGDRAELLGLPEDDPIWPLVSATSETRLGARCPFHEECFVSRARRAATEAQIIVVNHHLLCADLAVRRRFPEARLLPPYDALICDEAHQLEEVATAYFGTTLSSGRLAAFCRDLAAFQPGGEGPALGDVAGQVGRLGERLFAALRERALPAGAGLLLMEEGARAGLHGEHVSGEPEELALALDAALLGAQERTAGRGGEEGRRLAERARALRDDLALLIEGAARPGGAAVFWLEARGSETQLHASPVSAGAILRERLYADCPAVIFTSATLAPGGRFDFARQRLGLDGEDRAQELRLGSPFDYAHQALLYLPRDLPEPSDPRFVQQASRRIGELVRLAGGRAFLLFTSWRRMQQCWERLRGELSGRYRVLRQGEAPRRHLLERFVGAEAGAVLFATAAFWEGVDVVGPALQLVVMDKLPFAPPDDPLVTARCRRLEEEGLDPFAAYQVPRAALQVAQGFGRLIRHQGDRGVVALLDRRAAERGYGAQVLSALPGEVRRTADLGAVAAFYERA